jgi:hypothetical protein
MSLVNVVAWDQEHHAASSRPERFLLVGERPVRPVLPFGERSFRPPSKSSEFLMINDKHTASDGSMIMDQNYWYPYGTFSVYAIRVSGGSSSGAKATGFTVDPKMRYVYVDRFFESVCDQHVADLKTM